jgi:hypothetical protein
LLLLLLLLLLFLPVIQTFNNQCRKSHLSVSS